MNGINGEIKNFKNIIIFDESIKLEQIQSKIKNYDCLLISTNYESFEILKKNNIPQVNFDDYLSYQDLIKIQKIAYELSDWYKNEQISSYLEYENVNLGSLLQSEFVNILVNFLKKFYSIKKISKTFPNSKFFSSNFFSVFLNFFSLKYEILDSSKNEILPLDDLNTNISVSLSKFNLNLKFNKKKINSIRSLIENITNNLTNPVANNDSKTILFSEFNTKKYSNLFKKMPFFNDTYVIYNRRQPSIWDKESYSLVRNSKSIIENEKSLKFDKKSFFKNEESRILKILDNLEKNETVLEKIFVIDDISFWPIFKNFFNKLLKIRFFDYSYEVQLSHKLVNNYNFSSIVLLNEVGPNEKILLQIGKSQKIPIILLQHGLIFDTKEALTMNKYQGILGLDSDYVVVWGKIDEEYRKELDIDLNKIIKIGSPIYDNFNQKKVSEKNHILLATSGPTTEDVFDLKVETISKNISTIKKISEIVSSMNKKLIIKTHPSPDEYDPTKLVKAIDPKIDVIKSGDISELIATCSLMIVIDFSTVILDAYVLNKPIISVPVKDNGYGIPTAFIDQSILVQELNTLEKSINNILNDEKTLLMKSKLSCENYLSNPGNSSEKLLSFLSNLNTN